jgi:hypothetical protein
MTEQRNSLPSPALELDYRVRIAAFEFLKEQQTFKGEVLPRQLLAARFEF